MNIRNLSKEQFNKLCNYAKCCRNNRLQNKIIMLNKKVKDWEEIVEENSRLKRIISLDEDVEGYLKKIIELKS